MGDSWEDWDDDAADIPVPVASVTAQTFDDEDVEEDAPKWQGTVPETKEVCVLHQVT